MAGEGVGQGNQTNTATLIYCFTGQWNHCFDDYCARRPHYADYDERMLPQYAQYTLNCTVLPQDQTFRRLLIQISVPWVLRANFLRNLVHPSLTFSCGAYYWSNMEQHGAYPRSTTGHSAFRVHILNFFVTVWSMRVCNLFTTAIALSLVSAASATRPTNKLSIER